MGATTAKKLTTPKANPKPQPESHGRCRPVLTQTSRPDSLRATTVTPKKMNPSHHHSPKGTLNSWVRPPTVKKAKKPAPVTSDARVLALDETTGASACCGAASPNRPGSRIGGCPAHTL